MQRLHAVVILLVLCLAHVSYGFEEVNVGRGLKQGSSRSQSGASASGDKGKTKVSASAHASSTGGTSTAVASATSKAFTNVKSVVYKFCFAVWNTYKFPEYKGNDVDFCIPAYSHMHKDLTAAGKVLAKAYAKATAHVDVQGSGSACSNSYASAEAQARGFAKILAQGIAKATTKYSEAEAKARVSAHSDVLAQAFATAFATACSGSRGNAGAVTESFGKAVIKPIATIVLELYAEANCGNVPSFADASVVASVDPKDSTHSGSTTTAHAQGNAHAHGGGDGGAVTSVKCQGKYARCCFNYIQRKKFCSCNFFNRCKASKKSSNPTVWYDKKAKHRCHC